ncbi:MAG: transcription-repair coupling factor [Spirochaetes bacterium]|nr:transcription-repair coupling factor [Spirochaetota bacterium]
MTDFRTFLRLFDRTFNIRDIPGTLEKKRTEFTGLNGSARALFISALFQRLSGGIILITRSNRDASDFYGDLSLFLKENEIFLFPSRETLPYDDAEPFKEIIVKRIIALNALVKKQRGVFVLPVRTFTDFFIPKSIFEQSCIRLIKGADVSFSELEGYLIRLGYEREDRVSYQGCFAIRGDILDIFIYGNEYPFRVEFFDDTIESIREFSYVTQRSIKEVSGITVLPAREIILTPLIKKGLESILDEENREVVENIKEFGVFPGIDNYISMIYEPPGTILDYANRGYTFIVDSLRECTKEADFFKNEAVRLYKEKRGKTFLLPPARVMAELNNLLMEAGKYGNMSVLPETECDFIDFNITEKRGYRGQIKHLKEDIKNLLIEGYTVIVGASYEGQTNRLREVLKALPKVNGKLIVMTLDIHEGFISRRMKLAVILDREIFSRKKRYKRQFLDVRSERIEGMLDINNGDYIVHVEHGIGIYRGIEKLSTGGVEKDFIKIEYRDGDEIFIPVDQINRVQKYIGHKGRTPRIDRLGSGTWKKIKDHVKKSVKNLAKDLMEIYSIRASQKGYSFSRDTEWQYEFESGFRYEETPDQIRTIEELKNDMESPKPMDRLICGDVGFGKTEVAVRAAFKAAMDGKQVAVLVPTTILAEQHLGTFRDRFSLYPLNVEMLSRFRTPGEQKIILENLKNGLIDVVIGTHRLIQKDVKFKDLGLVVIDEEQRFGVEHKERFKQLRKLVDVITMTATPIPRTLYMSMTKIRDMSIIETPPRDRIPIETYVVEYNEEIIKRAIRREIERGGQVYYVHNRVRTIEEKAESLRRLMPEVTFEIAHGRMEERDLEEIMKAFFDMEFHTLLTTTIIESGLDIPNVNTIIIERADRFGLSQLYQLRGRVGRSKRKAYAYLLYPVGKVITEQAQKRLSVINDHTELGSGYSIALKDLEIRGAGNILGREQHGDMLTVGFEMYVKLLDEAIRELQHGQPVEVEIDPVLEIKYRGFIPGTYVESEKLRIEIYKRLAGVKREEELDEFKVELLDRFGAIPRQLQELFTVVRLRVLCRNVGIKCLREKENELQLIFEKSRVDIIKLVQKVNKNKRLFSISPKNYNTLYVYRMFQDNTAKLEFLKDFFDYEENT